MKYNISQQNGKASNGTATDAWWSPICLKDELPPSIHAPFYVYKKGAIV